MIGVAADIGDGLVATRFRVQASSDARGRVAFKDEV